MDVLKNLNDLTNEASFDRISKTYIFFRHKYPKFILLIISIFSAYFLFQNQIVYQYVSNLNILGYLGIFIAGLLFAFGFSAPFAVGFFIVLQPANILVAAIIAGSGALLADMLIFKFIKLSFDNEFYKLKKERPIIKLNKLIKNNLGLKISNYLLYFIAGILIASPLPDEVGVTMLAGLSSINQKVLAIISFVLNSLGIYIILLLST